MKMRKQEQRKVTQDIDRIRTLWGARAGSDAGEGTGTEQEKGTSTGTQTYQCVSLLWEFTEENVPSTDITKVPWVY